VQTDVLRDGQPVQVPLEEVVPGDIVLLSTGSLVPADAVVLDAADFCVNQAVLTGESFPVQKASGLVAQAADLTGRTNCVFKGTNVRSGTARCLVVATGSATEFGAIAHRLTLARPGSISCSDSQLSQELAGLRREGPVTKVGKASLARGSLHRI
jgi:Mg2+-importing ATPase